MIKKIVVYILLFSFLLLDLPQGVFAADPTPAPTKYNVGWRYVLNTIAGDSSQGERTTVQNLLRFYTEPSNDSDNKYVDFRNIYHGVSWVGEQEGMFTGTSHKWDMWISSNPSGQKFYIVSTAETSPETVMNICFPATDTVATQGKLLPYYILNSTSDIHYKCYNEQGGKPAEIISKNTAPQGDIPNLTGLFATAFKKIQQGLGGTVYSFAKISPMSRGSQAPKTDNVKLCQKFTTARQVKDDKAATLWINSIKANIAAIHKAKSAQASTANTPQASQPAADDNYASAFFSDASKVAALKAELIGYDNNSYKNYYGPSASSPVYPTASLTDQAHNSLLDEYQKVEDQVPLDNDSKKTAEISNNLIAVGIAAASLATFGAAVQGLGAASTLAFPTGTALMTETGTAAATIDIATVVGGSGEAATVSGWVIAGNIGKAVALTAGVWEASHTGSYVVDWLNNHDKKMQVDDWIKTLAEYQLDLSYVAFNTNFNKCLAEHQDPYALVNPLITDMLNNLGPSTYSGISSFDPTAASAVDKETGCPGLGFGSFLFGPLNSIMCNIMWFIWKGVSWFVGWTGKIAAKSVGYDTSSP